MKTKLIQAIRLTGFFGFMIAGAGLRLCWSFPPEYSPLSAAELKRAAPLQSKLIFQNNDPDEKTVRSGELSLRRYPLVDAAGKRQGLSSVIEIRFQSKAAVRINEDGNYPYLGETREADLDGNGLSDFIIIASYMGNGIPIDAVILLMQTEKGVFRRIDYDTYMPSFGDFIDFDHDGKYEVIVSRMEQPESLDGKVHSYWFYTVYQFKNDALVMNHAKADQFPKFIQFTDRPNISETEKLSPETKRAIVNAAPQLIPSRALN